MNNNPALGQRSFSLASMIEDARAHLPLIAAAVLMVLVVLVAPAFAGTDTTFDTAYDKFAGFLQGSGGKVITLISLAMGVAAMASGRFSMGQIALPVGVGIAVGTGVPIVTSTVSAII